MCGRYRLSRRKQIIEEHFDAISGEEDWGPRYNIAPTQPVVVIRQHPKKPIRELSLMRWGLVPSWAKDLSGAARMINARTETVIREAGISRCIEIETVPTSGGCDFTSGCERAGRNSPIVSRSTRGSCSRSRGCGIAGEMAAARCSRRARF